MRAVSTVRAPAVPFRVVPAGDREAVGEVWEHLESNGADTGLFASWAWTRTWLESFGPVVPHHFVVIGAADEPIGVALMTVDRHRRGPFSFRRAHVGTAGEPAGETVFVERNRLVSAPDRLRDVAGALVEHIRTLPGVDETALDGFLETDASALLGAGTGWSTGPEHARVVDLTLAGGEDVMQLFSRGVRKELRRGQRFLGPLSVFWAEDERTAQAYLDELIALHQSRWQERGLPGAFAAERVRRFHAALVSQWVPSGRLALIRVTSPQGLVGVRYAYVDRDRVLGYQTGWAPSTDPRVSPGLVLQHAVLEEARRRGYRCWDYLAGTTQLKQRLSTGGYQLVWASHLRPGARRAALHAARTGRSLLQAASRPLAGRRGPPAPH